MHMNSTRYLKLIAENNCYLLFEKGLKVDVISIKTPDGRELQGYSGLSRAMFDEFLAASLIAQDGPEDSDGGIVFRLTPDGRACAEENL